MFGKYNTIRRKTKGNSDSGTQYRPGVCSRTTETFSLGGGTFIANIDGPVRAIRSVIGANSGALTQRDWICCEGRMTVRTYLRVRPIACTWSFYDLSPEAHGMRCYDNLDPDGFLVDGGMVPNRRAEYDLHSCC